MVTTAPGNSAITPLQGLHVPPSERRLSTVQLAYRITLPASFSYAYLVQYSIEVTEELLYSR
jgi:hypothetical protein